MRNIGILGAKGGVGTTTVAATTALTISRLGLDTHIVAHDADVSAVLGIPLGGQTGVPNLTVSGNQRHDAEVNVWDVGADIGGLPLDGEWLDALWLVVRNDYLSLRRAVAMTVKPTGVVLIEEAGRPLTNRDVSDVLGVTPIIVPYDLAVARAIDAGLLAVRQPRSMSPLSTLAAA